jgi:hypothetical protein
MATLTVTIKEEVVLNGNEHGSENIIDIGNVDSMFERLIDCTVTEVPLLSFGSTVTGDTFVDDTVKYLRITNLDDTNYVTLRVLGASKEYFVVLEPKNSYVLFNDDMDANATGSQTASISFIDEIKAAANTATCQLSIFAAA